MNQNTEVIDLVTDDHMTHRKYSTTVYRYFDLMGCYNNSVINLQYHIEIKMKTQKSLNYITLLIASGIVVNFGLFVINVNAYFSITAKTFQGKGLTVTSYFDIFCLLVLEYITGIRDGFPIILSKIMIIY